MKQTSMVVFAMMLAIIITLYLKVSDYEKTVTYMDSAIKSYEGYLAESESSIKEKEAYIAELHASVDSLTLNLHTLEDKLNELSEFQEKLK